MASNDEELPDAIAIPGASLDSEQSVTLLNDFFNWLSVIRNLENSDVIVLLTPVAIPVSNDPGDNTDPFECFGNALQAHHHKVRHMPYTTRQGITSTHVGMIRRAKVAVFIISEPPRSEYWPQIRAALVTRKALSNEIPLLVILCYRPQNVKQFSEDFPTIIQSKDYTRPILEATASFIFGSGCSLLNRRHRVSLNSPPRPWQVEQWDEHRDIGGVYELWTQNIDVRFAIHVTTLAALLRRPGYARHYVVRDSSGRLLGFCATFLSYIDQAGDSLIASLAILLIGLEHQYEGIGLSLHNYAMEHLKRTRGVRRLQLGSTFPRILYGPPFYMEFDQTWFSRRGWRSDGEYPGRGQPVYDMLLDFASWKVSVPEGGAIFRNCTQNDMEEILELVEGEVVREHKIGWFDQYSRLFGDVNVKDVIAAVEGVSIVGVALTYTPFCLSPISLDLPWAGKIGDDVGGVTCICISPAKRDSLMVPLLNACIKELQKWKMKQVFLDAVTNDVRSLKQLGFKEWAVYRDIWRDI